MTIAEGSRSTIVEGTLRGCELALVHLHPLAPGGAACLLQLDRAHQTYSRNLTGAELLALVRLNPDDGMPDALLPLMSDVTLALTLVAGEWQMLTLLKPGNTAYACTVAPPVEDELSTLARLAGELLAAVGVS